MSWKTKPVVTRKLSLALTEQLITLSDAEYNSKQLFCHSSREPQEIGSLDYKPPLPKSSKLTGIPT
jgi:hypothetical protein